MYYSEVLGRSVVHYFDHVAYLTISAVPVVLLDALGICSPVVDAGASDKQS